MGKIILGILLAIILTGCNENSTKVDNNDPILLSLRAFPSIVNSGDSVIVICEAVEPDDDTLFYDWFTDSRLKIQDAGSDGFFLYNTRENTIIVYPTKKKDEPTDTAWVSCSVRDGIGGQSLSKTVKIIVEN